jgi:hypothetical protein
MPSPTTPSEWDAVRTAFASSILVDTALASLAENLDGPPWPGIDKSETPSHYIDCDYDEVVLALTLKGYAEETIDSLVEILRETLAFDDPFGDMVEQSQSAADADNPILDNLRKLGIPGNFPISHTSLSADTKEFCGRENLATLGEFAVFAQGMSQAVVVGGDFRSLLNSLSHIDEQQIKTFLPIRAGHKGLHFIEAVAAVVAGMSAIARRSFAASDSAASDKVSQQVAVLAKYFADQVQALDERIVQGFSLSRELMVLQNPETEPLVAKLVQPYLSNVVPVKKSGWFARLFGR